MSDTIRRIVTGNDANGKAIFVSDTRIPIDNAEPIWLTTADDPLVREGPDTPSLILPSTAPNLEPPPGGSRTLRISLVPWKQMEPQLAAHPIEGVDAKGFHRTLTIDYIFMLSGELELLLDDDKVTLGGGDIVIQRNTNHSWRNPTDAICEFHGTMVAFPVNWSAKRA